MFEQLLKVRYIAIVIVILAVLHAIAFLVLGTKVAIQAYAHVLRSAASTEPRPGLELLHSLDFLFVSLVLMVLALGIAKLFLLGPNVDESGLPTWLNTPYQPRFSGGEFSIVIKTAPPHSPPKKTPCRSRKPTSAQTDQ